MESNTPSLQDNQFSKWLTVSLIVIVAVTIGLITLLFYQKYQLQHKQSITTEKATELIKKLWLGKINSQINLVLALQDNALNKSVTVSQRVFPDNQDIPVLFLGKVLFSSHITSYDHNGPHLLVMHSDYHNYRKYNNRFVVDYDLLNQTQKTIYQETAQTSIQAFIGSSIGNIFVLEKITTTNNQITANKENGESYRIKIINNDGSQRELDLGEFKFQKLKLTGQIGFGQGLLPGINTTKAFLTGLPALLQEPTLIHTDNSRLFARAQLGCGGCLSALVKIDLKSKNITFYDDLEAYGFFAKDSPIYIIKTRDVYYLLDYEKNKISRISAASYEQYKKANAKFVIKLDSQNGNQSIIDLNSGVTYTNIVGADGSVPTFIPREKFIFEE